MNGLFGAAVPRADVLTGELRDEIFAARLEDVLRGTADPVYQDPTTFFANTFPTGGLMALLTSLFARSPGRARAHRAVSPSTAPDRALDVIR